MRATCGTWIQGDSSTSILHGNPVAAFRARAAMGIGQAVACELLDSVHSLVRQGDSSSRRIEAGHSWLSDLAAFFGLTRGSARDFLVSSKNGSESESLRCLGGDISPSPDPNDRPTAPSLQKGTRGAQHGNLAQLKKTSKSASGGVVLSPASAMLKELGPADFVVAIATHRARHSMLRATTASRKVSSPVRPSSIIPADITKQVFKKVAAAQVPMGLRRGTLLQWAVQLLPPFMSTLISVFKSRLKTLNEDPWGGPDMLQILFISLTSVCIIHAHEASCSRCVHIFGATKMGALKVCTPQW